MKKFIDTIKDHFYGCLPILILTGIPLMICAIIAWDDIITILTALGSGSVLIGIAWGIPGVVGAAIICLTTYYGACAVIDKIGNSKGLFITYIALLFIGFVWIRLNLWRLI